MILEIKINKIFFKVEFSIICFVLSIVNIVLELEFNVGDKYRKVKGK